MLKSLPNREGFFWSQISLLIVTTNVLSQSRLPAGVPKAEDLQLESFEDVY